LILCIIWDNVSPYFLEKCLLVDPRANLIRGLLKKLQLPWLDLRTEQ